MAAGTSIWQRIGFRRSFGVAEAGWGRTLVVAGVSFVYFLPVLFIIFTAIKPQALALSVPPTLSPTSLFGLIPEQFVFTPTLENFGSVFSRIMTVGGQPEATGFDRVPASGELQLDPQAAYLHFTSNNTIFGTQWATAPEPPKGVPLVCDMSSDAFSRPLDIARYGVIYAGAQKNLGPAGVTLVVMRKELLERVPAGLPSVLDYKLMAENRSLYNTPPCFAIYVTGLVLAWLREQGGLAAAGERNAAKASLVYEAIDGSDGFYRGHAEASSRSLMNVTWRLPTEELERRFVQEAAAAHLVELKGHRSVGGIRASLYNAMSLAGVQALADFMWAFADAERTPA